jgi:EAL domain
MYTLGRALMAVWAFLSWENSFQTKPVDEIAYLVCLLFALAARPGPPPRRAVDLNLVDTIDRLLTAHRVPPQHLILEITEGTFANDSSRSCKTVFALRRLGVRISLDDYGTAWSC